MKTARDAKDKRQDLINIIENNGLNTPAALSRIYGFLDSLVFREVDKGLRSSNAVLKREAYAMYKYVRFELPMKVKELDSIAGIVENATRSMLLQAVSARAQDSKLDVLDAEVVEDGGDADGGESGKAGGSPVACGGEEI